MATRWLLQLRGYVEHIVLPSCAGAVMERPLDVLVVENHAPAARVLADLLALDGHRVRLAPDGPSAVALAAASAPDVALLDLNLGGGMDGYDVARALQAEAGERRPLLVVLTGQPGEEFRVRSCREGIDLHLVKPVEAGDLRAVLRRFGDVLRLPGAGGDSA
jgi:two-component system CheB/CheR fusion protein